METLRYVVLINGLLAVISLIYYSLLRHETFFGANRLVLWLGLAGTLLFPILELPDWRPQPVRNVMHRTAQAIVPRVLPELRPSQPDVTITFPNQQTYQAFQGEQKRFAWSWLLILSTLYIAVVSALLTRFGIQLLSLRRLIQQSDHYPHDDFILLYNRNVKSPFSFLRWVVLNPERHTPDELDQILRHERVHVQEWHSLDILAAEFICILFWFNPAAYLFRYLIHQVLEFQADYVVLTEGVDAKSYQYNLLKVSLLGNPSGLTNHFSKSQLKSRIAMINQQKSSNGTWLKYPVLFIVSLTVAAAFAHPQQLSAVATHVSKPMADTLRSSSSKYMRYEGDKLYWIITPRTSFDDLAAMKREFERHGYKMLVQSLKYDPLNVYISDIKIKIIRPIVGVSDFEETGVNGGPIRSCGGYNGLNKLNDVAAIGSYPFDTDFLSMPEGLIQLARNEEIALSRFIRDNRMKYLVAAGEKIGRSYAPSSSSFNLISLSARPDILSRYGIKLDTDSTLTISDSHPAIFINNEPVSNEAAKRIAIKKMDKLISSEEYSRNGQQGAVRALFFYTNEAQ